MLICICKVNDQRVGRLMWLKLPRLSKHCNHCNKTNKRSKHHANQNPVPEAFFFFHGLFSALPKVVLSCKMEP